MKLQDEAQAQHITTNELSALTPERLEAENLALADLRLPQNFTSSVEITRHTLTIPVGKPHRQWWVRVHPSEEYRLDAAVIELKEERETYLVLPKIANELSLEITPKSLYLSINSQGVVFFWAVRLPDATGKIDEWNRVAREAAKLATTKWIRLVSNMSLGSYEILETGQEIAKVAWPAETMEFLIRRAFAGRVIDNIEHPIIKKLRGGI